MIKGCKIKGLYSYEDCTSSQLWSLKTGGLLLQWSVKVSLTAKLFSDNIMFQIGCR